MSDHVPFDYSTPISIISGFVVVSLAIVKVFQSKGCYIRMPCGCCCPGRHMDDCIMDCKDGRPDDQLALSRRKTPPPKESSLAPHPLTFFNNFGDDPTPETPETPDPPKRTPQTKARALDLKIQT